MQDMEKKNGSGFDFSDLAADFSGIEFGKLVMGSGERLKTIRDKFTVDDYVPKIDDLADGLSKKRFEERYGGLADQRFIDAVDAVRKRVQELPAYKTRKEN